MGSRILSGCFVRFIFVIDKRWASAFCWEVSWSPNPFFLKFLPLLSTAKIQLQEKKNENHQWMRIEWPVYVVTCRFIEMVSPYVHTYVKARQLFVIYDRAIGSWFAKKYVIHEEDAISVYISPIHSHEMLEVVSVTKRGNKKMSPVDMYECATFFYVSTVHLDCFAAPQTGGFLARPVEGVRSCSLCRWKALLLNYSTTLTERAIYELPLLQKSAR